MSDLAFDRTLGESGLHLWSPGGGRDFVLESEYQKGMGYSLTAEDCAEAAEVFRLASTLLKRCEEYREHVAVVSSPEFEQAANAEFRRVQWANIFAHAQRLLKERQEGAR